METFLGFSVYCLNYIGGNEEKLFYNCNMLFQVCVCGIAPGQVNASVLLI